ncbi:MAG: efflux RND transporter periplasmic adaptor subunit [Bryobacteraceae bacterium]
MSATLWSEKTELFLEFPPLVQSADSRFAIHLTRLSDFKPVRAGRCEVRLTYSDGSGASFASDGPSRPGIFGVTVKPARTGTAFLEIRLASADLTDVHKVEPVRVYGSTAEVPAKEKSATEETIAFLKEQQWALDFATVLAGSGTARESLRVPAEVSPRSGGEVAVVAPLAGRLTAETAPVFGARVQQGQILAAVIPPTAVPSDRASLDLGMAEAEAAVEYARRDKERASRVVDAGAAPRKRLDEALTAERTAEARLRAADERIRLFESTRSAEGGAGSTAFAIRAPITGTIVETSASPGATVRVGEPLLRIVDTERVFVSAIVPEAEYPKVRNLAGAEIEIPGLSQPRPAGRLVSIGKVVDPSTRTFPVVYEFANTDGRIAINQTVTIRLFLSGQRRGVMIPEAALVDDGGRPVVFLQREGEAFVRRPVEVGYRQSGLAEITSGLQAGDRIVTRGAYLIRLAALSTQIPAHGHVH